MGTGEYRDIDTLDAEDIRNNTEISAGNKFVDFDDFHSRLDEIKDEIEDIIIEIKSFYDTKEALEKLEELEKKLY